ncbi:hypothetical protein KKC91_07965 [bacterium]|nr:hypothetical protein [bacterium]
MSIENIIKKIEADAEGECKVLRDRAALEIKQIQEQAKNQAKKEREGILKHAKEQAEKNMNKAVVSANLECRIKSLKVRQDIISLCFEKAYGKTLNLPPSDYLKLMELKLLKLTEIGDEKIIFGDLHREKFNSDFINRINKKLVSGGKKGRICISNASRPIKAGFILIKEKQEINASLEQLIKILRHKLLIKINNVLFGQQV